MIFKNLKTTAKFNIFAFFCVFITAFLLFFKQIFVYPNYELIPLKKFFNKQLLTKVFASLTFKPPLLAQQSDYVNAHIIVQSDCQDICYFNFINTKDSSLVKRIPAIVDIDPTDRLKDLKIKFFDRDKGLIGYHNNKITNPVFYVMNSDQELLQAIQLRINNMIDISFIEYYSASQQILFQSINQSTGEQRQFLYSAVSPSLMPIL